jgi:hypothetical protein
MLLLLKAKCWGWPGPLFVLYLQKLESAVNIEIDSPV